jgi:predicted sugar kinase
MARPMKMQMTSPASLTLAAARVDGRICELALTLRYPPIQLVATPAPRLTVSGARADLAYRQAHALGLAAEIEIELAIAANMGLGSDAMLGACMRRLATALNALAPSMGPSPSDHALAQGGLLLVDDAGGVRERAEIAHSDESDDWVIVLVLPREPDDLPEDYEVNAHAALLSAARDDATIVRDFARVFDAIRRDDFAAFAQAVADAHAANEAALAAAGALRPLDAAERNILAYLRSNGGVACARTLTGLGLYGLIRGGGPSRVLRKALTTHFGYFGPLVMASICDNQGATVKVS